MAKTFSKPVLMSNSTGPGEGFESTGQSAVWDSKGDLIDKLDRTEEGILTFDTTKDSILKQTLHQPID